jgi:hypothetical protein
LINGLLKLDPKERLGNNGPEEFENHPFFAGVDWAKYQKQDSVPPIKPMVKSSDKGSGSTGYNYKPTPDNRTRLENVNVTNFTYQGQKDALARRNSGLNSQGKW